MEIRKMTAAYADAVAAIEKEIFSDPWSRQGFLDAMAFSENRYLVAEEGTTIQGYCGYYRSMEEADIVNVAVAEPFRKRKIATKLLTRLMEEGIREGVRAFWLEVRISNQAAISLYRSLGFEMKGIRKGFYEKPREDACLMCRKIMDLSGSISH